MVSKTVKIKDPQTGTEIEKPRDHYLYAHQQKTLHEFCNLSYLLQKIDTQYENFFLKDQRT
ncbi:MAG: hypothetical protein RCG15_03715 [Candidatus Rickettsia vulgarisii]